MFAAVNCLFLQRNTLLKVVGFVVFFFFNLPLEHSSKMAFKLLEATLVLCSMPNIFT